MKKELTAQHPPGAIAAGMWMGLWTGEVFAGPDGVLGTADDLVSLDSDPIS